MQFRSAMAVIQGKWLLFLVAVIPLSLYYVTKEPFAISWLNLLSVGFIGLGVVNALTSAVPFQPIRQRYFGVMLLLFLAAMAWALVFTHPLRDGIGLWTSRLVQPLLVGYFSYCLLIKRHITPRQIVAALFVSLVLLLVVGALQLAGVIEYRDPGRITATYFYPNTMARYVDIILVVSLPWLLFGGVTRKRLGVGVWLLGVVLLLLSQSYNGVVSLFAGLVVILVVMPSNLVKVKQWGLAVLVIGAAIVVINAPKLPKYQTSITDSRLTRLEFWQVATNVIRDHFWTGIGIKTWEKQYPQLVQTYYSDIYHRLPRNWGSVQPHNVFLDSFIKAGLPGFLAITTVLIWPIVEGRAFAVGLARRDPDWWVGVSLCAYGVAMLVFGLIDDPIWSDDTMPLLFILYFLLVYCVTRRAPSPQQ